MSDIFNHLTEGQADAYGLVLSSSGISYVLERDPEGWNVSVADRDRTRALNLIETYLKENEAVEQPQETVPHEYGRTLSGLWVSLLLLGFHASTSLIRNKTGFFEAYGSAAGPILNGEVFRTLTSLMIHTSALHLAGNMLGIALFGTAVCRIAGPGAGWFLILATGAGGNYMNALFYGGRHLSVGSSTAVFGAVGILAGYQFLKKLRGVEGPRKSWLPLAAGLALLAFLGAGERSDLTAHLFGFLSGIAAGVSYGLILKRPVSRLAQGCFGFIDLGLVAAAWIAGTVGDGA